MLHFNPDKIKASIGHGAVDLRIRGIHGSAHDLLPRDEFAFNGVVNSNLLSSRGRPGVEPCCGVDEGGEESCCFNDALASGRQGFKGKFRASGFAVLDWFFSWHAV